MKTADRKFLGIEHCNWCVLSNLLVVAVLAALVAWLLGLAWSLRWYWVGSVFFIAFFPISFVIERRPVGTYFVEWLYRRVRPRE